MYPPLISSKCKYENIQANLNCPNFWHQWTISWRDFWYQRKIGNCVTSSSIDSPAKKYIGDLILFTPLMDNTTWHGWWWLWKTVEKACLGRFYAKSRSGTELHNLPSQISPVHWKELRDHAQNTTNPAIVVCNVIPILIGPSKWALITSIIYHVGKGIWLFPFPITGERTRT